MKEGGCVASQLPLPAQWHAVREKINRAFGGKSLMTGAPAVNAGTRANALCPLFVVQELGRGLVQVLVEAMATPGPNDASPDNALHNPLAHLAALNPALAAAAAAVLQSHAHGCMEDGTAVAEDQSARHEAPHVQAQDQAQGTSKGEWQPAFALPHATQPLPALPPSHCPPLLAVAALQPPPPPPLASALPILSRQSEQGPAVDLRTGTAGIAGAASSDLDGNAIPLLMHLMQQRETRSYPASRSHQ